MFTDLTLCYDNKYLLSSHTGGTISVINLESQTAQFIEDQFGYVENIWGVKCVGQPEEGKP